MMAAPPARVLYQPRGNGEVMRHTTCCVSAGRPRMKNLFEGAGCRSSSTTGDTNEEKNLVLGIDARGPALSLYGCGNGSDSDLAVDNNAQSCSVVSGTGSAVVVGSGLPATLLRLKPHRATAWATRPSSPATTWWWPTPRWPPRPGAMCQAGGTAVDAAVAVQAVLGLVEPQSSTIAGSAFMMYYDAANKKVVACDGRETARCRHRLLPGRAGTRAMPRPRPVPSARRSGRSIGCPA